MCLHPDGCYIFLNGCSFLSLGSQDRHVNDMKAFLLFLSDNLPFPQRTGNFFSILFLSFCLLRTYTHKKSKKSWLHYIILFLQLLFYLTFYYESSKSKVEFYSEHFYTFHLDSILSCYLSILFFYRNSEFLFL